MFARAMVMHGERMLPSAESGRLMVERCETCGEEFVRAKGRRRHYCPECRISRSVSAQRDAMNRHGPMWEKLVLGQLRRWTEEAEKLGLTLEGG